MKMLDLSCPGCGAQMTYREVEKTAYCEYCGRKMLVRFDLEQASEDALSRTKNEEMTEEELAEKRRKNLLKAQAISDGYKNFNWEEDRADFNLTSQNAWRRTPVDSGRSFWDWDPEYSDYEPAWVKAVGIVILLMIYIGIKLFA